MLGNCEICGVNRGTFPATASSDDAAPNNRRLNESAFEQDRARIADGSRYRAEHRHKAEDIDIDTFGDSVNEVL